MTTIPMFTLVHSLILLIAVRGAHADVEQWWWVDGTSYGYELSHMADFDQNRLTCPGTPGLPGDGEAYCVPTAMMDLAAYAARHGFPDVAPGDQEWQLPEHYDAATVAISILGSFMGAADGTDAPGLDAGMASWFGIHDDLVWETHYLNDGWAPTLNGLTAASLQGKLVAFAFGIYDVLPGGALEIQGGHMVAFTGSYRLDSYMQLSFRNPHDGGDADCAQNLFANQYGTAADGTFAFTVPPAIATTTTLQLGQSEETVFAMNTMVTLAPKSGLTFTPGTDYIGPVHPISFTGYPIPHQWHYPIPSGSFVVDADHLSGGRGIAVGLRAGEGPDTVEVLDTLTYESTASIEVDDICALTTGRRGELFACDGSNLLRVLPESPDPVQGVFAAPATALAYDDRTDELVFLELDGSRLGRIDHRLEGVPSFVSIPTIPLAPQTRIATARSGRVWVASPAATALYAVSTDGAIDVLSMPAGASPTSVGVDGAGRVFVMAGGSVHEAEFDLETGWTWVSEPFFDASVDYGDVLLVSRSRTNFDPALHGDSRWMASDPTLLPPPTVIPDCPGDVDGNGGVDFNDLLVVLASWGGSGFGDANIDGTVNFGDVLVVLAHWGESC